MILERVLRLTKVYRGEETKILHFMLFQFILSVIIGSLTTGVDLLYLKHPADSFELAAVDWLGSFGALTLGSKTPSPVVQLIPLLLSLSAIVLMVLGISHALITDRVDKAKLAQRTLWMFIIASLLFYGALLAEHYGHSIPLLYSVMYIWRFVLGVFLLLIFWESALLYFDSRQGRRLFPLMMMSGAIGYALGNIIISMVSPLLSLRQLFPLYAILAGLALWRLYIIEKSYQRIEAVRYRRHMALSEIIKFFETMWSNDYLRFLAYSTLIFGILSGLIMFTYNAIAQSFMNDQAATQGGHWVVIQRTVITLLQPLLITKLLSQTEMGTSSHKGVIARIFFLLAGVFLFLLSMAGVADFSRQIALALMSPAAMASFAVLPAAYRGRAMSINNLVIAAIGIFISGIICLFAASWIPLTGFLIAIFIFTVSRLVFNVPLNRAYVRWLSKRGERKKGNLSSIVQDLSKIAAHPEALEENLQKLSSQPTSVRRHFWQELVNLDGIDIRRLQKYRPEVHEDAFGCYLQLLYKRKNEGFEPAWEMAAESRSDFVQKAYWSLALKIDRKNQLTRLLEHLSLCEVKSIDACLIKLEALMQEFSTVAQEKERIQTYLEAVIQKLNDKESSRVFIKIAQTMPPVLYDWAAALAENNQKRRGDLLKTLNRHPQFPVEPLIKFYENESQSAKQILWLESIGQLNSKESEQYLLELLTANIAELAELSDEQLLKWPFLRSSDKMKLLMVQVKILASKSSALQLSKLHQSSYLAKRIQKATHELWLCFFKNSSNQVFEHRELILKWLREECQLNQRLVLLLSTLQPMAPLRRKVALDNLEKMENSLQNIPSAILDGIENGLTPEITQQSLPYFENIATSEVSQKIRSFVKSPEPKLKAFLDELKNEKDRCQSRWRLEWLAMV